MENNNNSFELILHAGNAKSMAMEAIYAAKEKKEGEAKEKLQSAKAEMILAHKIQAQLLFDEAGGSKQNVDVLLVHAMDHMALATLICDLAEEMIGMRIDLNRLQSASKEY